MGSQFCRTVVGVLALAVFASAALPERPTNAIAQAVEKIKPALATIQQAVGKDNKTPEGKPARTVLGILIDARGTVVTNHSLIKGWEKIEVVISDGRCLPAKTVRSDPALDLAIITVEHNRPLPCAEVADSEKIKVGDLVLALSHPWAVPVDEPLMVTSGRVAGKVRGAKEQDLLAVDVTIGPGCSPGPLITRDARFAGLVVSREHSPRFTNGAIPSKRIVERLAEWSREDQARPKSKTTSLAFSPDGRKVVSLESDQTLRFWDVASGKDVKRLAIPLDKDERPEQVSYGPDANAMVLLDRYEGFRFDRATGVATQGTISSCLWPASTGKKSLWVRTGPGGRAVSPDGKMLAYGHDLWDSATGKRLRKIDVPGGLIYQIGFSPDGKVLAYWICESLVQNTSVIFLADVATGKKLLQVGDLDLEISAFCFRSPATFSPDGKTIAFTEPRSPPRYTIRLWSTSAAKEVQGIPQEAHADLLAFSADGKTLLSWERTHGVVRLWDPVTAKERRAVKIGVGVRAVTVSPDGKTAALVKDEGIEFRKLEE